MPLLAVGINHKTAPVQIREKVAFPSAHLPEALRNLRERGGVREAAILSTCNRTELYCGLDHDDGRVITQWLGNYHNLGFADLQPYLYQHPGQSAVRHMLRVASGLDSMLLGEPQILGQVKSAYQSAVDAGTLGTLLDRLFQHTFAVAKQVRTDTCIGASPISVAFAAVSLSKQIFGELFKQTALLIGAGQTIELVARHLHDNRIGRMIVANRTLDRAHELATHFNGYGISLDEIPAHVGEADIVITSTSNPGFILVRSQIERALRQRKHRPIFMVDIAVPRDIDPSVGELRDVYLYTVDDLQEVIQENLRSRQAAAEQAEDIIDIQVEQFMAWLRAHDNADAIRALRSQAETIRDEICARARRQLNQGKDPGQVLDFLARTLTNKLIHNPSAGLREAGAQGRTDLIHLIKILYKLDSREDKDH
jgi:glutamyl-tRNA reductase